MTPVLADGTQYAWNPAARTWRMVAMARDCDTVNATPCANVLSQLDTVWQLMGREADRVDVLWVGAVPAQGARPAHAAHRARQRRAARWPCRVRRTHVADRIVYVLDPNGSWFCATLRASIQATCAPTVPPAQGELK